MAYQFWCHRGEPQRTRFVGFEHGYHGDTFGAMAVSRDPLFFGRFEPLLFQADIVPLDPRSARRAPARAARARSRRVILEPLVQGAGGHADALARDAAANRRGGATARRALHRRRGDDRRRPHGHAVGASSGRRRARSDLRGQDADRRHAAAGRDAGRAARSSRRSTRADRTRTFFHGHSFTANPLACAVAVANCRRSGRRRPDAPRELSRVLGAGAWRRCADRAA